MRKSVLIFVLSLFGLLSVSTLVILCAFGTLFRHQIQSQIQLLPNTQIYSQWTKPTVPIFLQFYFFNLTNPSEFLHGRAKPRLQQLGPYTYREERIKRNVSYDPLNGTIDYREVKQYHFVPSMSHGSDSDVITNINLVYLTLAYQLTWLPAPMVHLFEYAEQLFKDQLIMQHSVHEWLWGYTDHFLAFLRSVHFPVDTATIGLYANRNSTDDGWVRIDSGLLDRNRIGLVLAYHNQSKLSVWTTNSTNQINGSDGSLFHPFLEPGEAVDVFGADICRSIRFTPRGTVYREDGLAVIKYLPLEDTFDSPKLNVKNRGFCLHWPECYETGALDMSTCQPGTPIAMSMPHFVHANRTYQDAVEGLHPSAEFNTTFLIEPLTGIVVSASKKIQLNVNVTQSPKSRQLSNISTVLMPLMFINESVTLDAETIAQLRYSIVVVPMIVKLICTVVLTLSAITILSVILIQHRQGYQQLDSLSDDNIARAEPSERQPLLANQRAASVVGESTMS